MVLFNKSYFILFVLLISCSKGENDINSKGSEDLSAQSKNTVSEVSYKMLSNEKTVKDDDSPMGEWTLSESYPELKGKVKDDVKAKINKSIRSLSKKYKCKSKGEHTFTSNVKYLSPEIFSINYEAMWYCPPMASPDSTTGAITFNLISGNNVLIESQYINSEASSAFNKFLSKKINSQLNSGEECSIKNNFDYYYKVKNALVFVYDVEQHSDSGCITEIKIINNELVKFIKPKSVLLMN